MLQALRFIFNFLEIYDNVSKNFSDLGRGCIASTQRLQAFLSYAISAACVYSRPSLSSHSLWGCVPQRYLKRYTGRFSSGIACILAFWVHALKPVVSGEGWMEYKFLFLLVWLSEVLKIKSGWIKPRNAIFYKTRTKPIGNNFFFFTLLKYKHLSLFLVERYIVLVRIVQTLFLHDLKIQLKPT